MQVVSKREGITFNLSRVALLPSRVIDQFESHDRHFEGLRDTLYMPAVGGGMILGTPTPPLSFGHREYRLKLLSCVVGNSHATASADEIAKEYLTVALRGVLHENPTGQILITPVYAYPVKGFASTIKQRYYLYWTKS